MAVPRRAALPPDAHDHRRPNRWCAGGIVNSTDIRRSSLVRRHWGFVSRTSMVASLQQRGRRPGIRHPVVDVCLLPVDVGPEAFDQRAIRRVPDPSGSESLCNNAPALRVENLLTGMFSHRASCRRRGQLRGRNPRQSADSSPLIFPWVSDECACHPQNHRKPR